MITKQEILHTYGKSVYQIRLEIAMQLFAQTEREAPFALKLADEFVAALQAENHSELVSKFP
jgi:hypothetical protein